MTRTFLAAIAAGGALLVAGCGASSSSDSSTAGAGNSVDRAFVARMIPHHQSAVQMATIAKRRGTGAFVKQLAGDIVRTQTQEISTMRSADRRLRTAGVKQGSLGVPEHMMGMGGDVGSLSTATPFDPAFMRMMIPHHEGAVRMANAELENGNDPELETLARNIIAAQRREIRQMRRQLGDNGAGGGMDASSMRGAGHSGWRHARRGRRHAAA